LTATVPIIPARDVATSAAFYRDMLQFAVKHIEDEYGIVERDDIQIHFWGPSGIAPTASNTMIRIEVTEIETLYAECAERGIVHPNAPLREQPWGLREFAIGDLDGNLVTFFESLGRG